MTRSMTGFGTAAGSVGAAHVSVEVRAVNHRFFNVSIRLPVELSRWEGVARDALRSRIARGHVTVVARYERRHGGALAINEGRFRDWAVLLRELQARYDVGGTVDIASILRLPDVVVVDGEDGEASASEFLAIIGEATASLEKSRGAEGARLVTYLRERLAVIRSALERIALRAPARIVEQRERLRQAVREIMTGHSIDDSRIALEVAVLAERLDVQEELSRFHAHLAAFEETLARVDEPIGKRLGFLLQEMLREGNTTGSKANDSAMLADVVIIKEELERTREQVENLE
ncbi:MAG: YicC/YloC family endoribonuclease [Gemmatimonadota bacterium]